MNLLHAASLVLIVASLAVAIYLYVKRKPYASMFSATGPWHKIASDGEPNTKGIPVLTEYINNAAHKWHGYRVDTYSTKLHKWMEADVWDQKVVAYAEIKSPK